MLDLILAKLIPCKKNNPKRIHLGLSIDSLPDTLGEHNIQVTTSITKNSQ